MDNERYGSNVSSGYGKVIVYMTWAENDWADNGMSVMNEIEVVDVRVK
jgi:hypothetical protein